MRTSHRRVLGAMALVVAGVITASPAVGDTQVIKAAGSAGNWHWNPNSRTITTGDTIKWKNPTGSQHRVTAYGGNWSKNTTLAANGGKTSKTFNKTGTYKFRCTINDGTSAAHSKLENGKCSGMCGKVRVTG